MTLDHPLDEWSRQGPSDQATNPIGFGYVFNRQQSGRAKTNDHIPLMIERTNVEWNASALDSSVFVRRHGDIGNAAFTDGAVKSVKSLTLSAH
jgi:hypothetical protein